MDTATSYNTYAIEPQKYSQYIVVYILQSVLKKKNVCNQNVFLFIFFLIRSYGVLFLIFGVPATKLNLCVNPFFIKKTSW